MFALLGSNSIAFDLASIAMVIQYSEFAVSIFERVSRYTLRLSYRSMFEGFSKINLSHHAIMSLKDCSSYFTKFIIFIMLKRTISLGFSEIISFARVNVSSVKSLFLCISFAEKYFEGVSLSHIFFSSFEIANALLASIIAFSCSPFTLYVLAITLCTKAEGGVLPRHS